MRSPAPDSRAGAALLRGKAVGDVTSVSPPINSAGALVDGAPALLGEMVSVPRHWPTEDMIEAGYQAHRKGGRVIDVYLAMVGVAAR